MHLKIEKQNKTKQQQQQKQTKPKIKQTTTTQGNRWKEIRYLQMGVKN